MTKVLHYATQIVRQERYPRMFKELSTPWELQMPRVVIRFRQRHGLKTKDTLHLLCPIELLSPGQKALPIELSAVIAIFSHPWLLVMCGYWTCKMFIHSMCLMWLWAEFLILFNLNKFTFKCKHSDVASDYCIGQHNASWFSDGKIWSLLILATPSNF